MTSFGEYVNAKRRVFLVGNLSQATANELNRLIERAKLWDYQAKFAGDPLPKEFLKLIKQ